MFNKKMISLTSAFVLMFSMSDVDAGAAKKDVKMGRTVELGQFHEFAPNTCDSRRVRVDVLRGRMLGSVHTSQIQKRIRDVNSRCNGKLVTFTKVDFRAGHKPGSDIVTIKVTFVAGKTSDKYYKVKVASHFDG